MVQALGLEADFIVDQGVGPVGRRGRVLIGPGGIGLLVLDAAIESTRPEALRPGVVEQHVVGDMPAQVRAAAEAVVYGVIETCGVQVGSVRGAAKNASAARLPVAVGRRGAGTKVRGRD